MEKIQNIKKEKYSFILNEFKLLNIYLLFIYVYLNIFI
jgi:hypothetical protein